MKLLCRTIFVAYIFFSSCAFSANRSSIDIKIDAEIEKYFNNYDYNKIARYCKKIYIDRITYYYFCIDRQTHISDFQCDVPRDGYYHRVFLQGPNSVFNPFKWLNGLDLIAIDGVLISYVSSEREVIEIENVE